jgi:hypothetical protein
MARFVQPSKLRGMPLGDHLASKFPEDWCEKGFDEFDGAFVDMDSESVTVHCDPWFPDFWIPLPKTPWDLGEAKPFDPTR